MTDITQLAKQAGFLPRLTFQLEAEFKQLEQLLRDKFIAELGEPVLFAVKDYVDCAKYHNGQTLCALKNTELHSIPLYALKDERT